MKNRTVGFILALLACVPILLQHAVGDALLRDSDTNFLIFKLNEYNDPWRWFTHDWPLENHFYRPISTLVFELDNRLHPGNGTAFGITNAIICCLACLALYWFLCELKRSIPVAIAGTWLFACWTLGGWFFGRWYTFVIDWMPWVLMLLIIGRMFANKKFNWTSFLVGAGGFYIWSQLYNLQPSLSGHTMYWLPGRTATTMAVLALIALASYVRFERLAASPMPPRESTPLDPPATRSSSQNEEPKSVYGWLIVSLLATALSLGAYEQAVMIPTLIFIVGVWLRFAGYRTRFSLQIFFWAILVAYIVYRVQIIPVKPSGYQKQQFRDGLGLWIDILSYLFPGLLGLLSSINGMSAGIMLIFTETFWTPIGAFFFNVSAWVTVRKKTIWPLLALLLAVFAYLPMAFLKQFGHYHYLPAALMTLFVISLFEVYWPRLVAAISPGAIQAPKRLERAPGSLPK